MTNTPMKSILMTIAMLSLNGCNEPTMLESENDSLAPVEVTFGSSILSRMADDVWEEGDAIGVFMFKGGESASSGTLVSRAGGHKYLIVGDNGSFQAATENDRLYYPSGHAVDFMAYYPYSSVDGLSLHWDIARQQDPSSIDLLYSANLKGITPRKERLGLLFSHQLCKLTISVEVGEGEDIPAGELDNLRVFLDGVPTRASYSLLTGDFTGFAGGEDRLQAKVIGREAQFLVYPGVCDGKKVTVVTDSRDYTFRIASAEKPWAKGHHYSYTLYLDKHQDSPELESTIVPWGKPEAGHAESEGNPDMAPAWDGKSSDTGWYDPSASSFTLVSPSQLCGLSGLVAAGHTFKGMTVRLGKDLDLGGHPFPVIGTDEAHAFEGAFDGGGHTIGGFRPAWDSGSKYAALFGLNRGTVENLSASGEFQVESTQHYTYAAGLVALNEGTVGDCCNYVSVSADVDIQRGESSNLYAGGVVGVNKGTVSGSRNYGRVEGTHSNAQSVSNTYVGGVAGQLNNGRLRDCANYQSVYGQGGYAFIGGVCGYLAGPSTDGSSSSLSGSANYGDVLAGDVSKEACAGGIVGKAALCPTTLIRCLNRGDVQASGSKSGAQVNSGGLVGSALLCIVSGNENSGCVTALNTASPSKCHAGGLAGSLGKDSELHASVQLAGSSVRSSGMCGGLVGNLELGENQRGFVYGCNRNEGMPLKWIGSAEGDKYQSGVSFVQHDDQSL